MVEQGSSSDRKEEESVPAYEDAGHSSAPPAYTSLPQAVSAGMESLRIGDPKDSISVPMVLSTEQKRKRDIFLPGGKPGKVTQTVIVRKMTREYYLQHYAKDAEGNYIGTEKAAVDAGLVFVPGKSSSEEILEQVRKVAFGKQHSNTYFADSMALSQAGGGAM
ncbi:Nn.00g014260.m01.CDS01 [Neocucurbitaria sp. VM-36]